MRILMAGDVVGGPGRQAFAQVVTRLRHEQRVDFVVANAENAAGGKGITGVLAEEMLAAGADVLTLGDHAWDQKEAARDIERIPRLLRPANFAPGCPGRGVATVHGPVGAVTVINLVGRVFMPPVDCPFRAVDAILRQESGLSRVILVDIHAEATSEKGLMGRYLDGRVSCVAGTHTHVQTSDEVLLRGGTAFITDLGMTGPKNSILGRDVESVTARMLTGMPVKFTVATDDLVLEGIIVDIDPATGKALRIKRLRERAD